MLIVLVDQFCAIDFPDGHLLRTQHCNGMQMVFRGNMLLLKYGRKKVVRSHCERTNGEGQNLRKREGGGLEAPLIVSKQVGLI